MKNLFAIPRLSLPETFTILITLVVCLVGFTNAEVYSNHRKRNPNQREKENFLLQKSSFRESVPYSHEKPKISIESKQRKFASLRDLPESPFDKLVKAHSDYFGESEDTDSEKESDGYGYDDDEYYHFNFKRNDDAHGSKESVKSDKEDAGEVNVKDSANSENVFRNKHKETDKETETIEMLNFKECHTGGKNANSKPFSDEVHKKQFSTDGTSSLKMSDIRENSAIDEKVKDRKDSGAGVAADEKLMDNKNDPKSDGKDSAKLKDVKMTEDSEKREKESPLKDVKDAVAPKTLKESSNASEEKEKTLKLSENVRLQDNVNKVDSKSKEPAKIVKGEEEVSNYSDKLNEDELSEVNRRANFVTNDYKESAEGLKTTGVDEDEGNSYEVNDANKANDLDNGQELRMSQDKFRKQDKARERYAGERLKTFNRQNMKRSENFRGLPSEANFLRKFTYYDTSNLSPKDVFKKSQFWREGGLRDGKSRHQQNSLQQKAELEQNMQEFQDMIIPMDQMQSQAAQNSAFDTVMKNSFGLNFAELDSENGDLRKGCVKPLKKLKGFNEKSKTLFPESLNTDSLVKSSHDRLEAFMKEPREAKKRRSMSLGVSSEGKRKIYNKYSNSKRNVQGNPGGQSKKSQVHSHEFKQEVSSIKNSKSGSSLLTGENREEQQESSRLRRKTPQKFEYEIKVINQNKEDNNRGMDQVSHYGFKRVEKDLKSRFAVEDKYPKKYPFSQVSRDDLLRVNKMTESENYAKNKRRAPAVKRHDKYEETEEVEVQLRAAPSGYYGNRVKFGQKSPIRGNDADHARFEENDAVFPYLNTADKSPGQKAREVKDEDFKHGAIKRFDENGAPNKGNSLLLIKKDERTTKTFDEGSMPVPSENDFNSEILAKILSKDNDFLVLKRTDNNKFQKISENANFPNIRVEAANNQPLKGSSFGEDEDQKSKAKQGFLKKGLQTRSFLFEKEDKKYPTSLHGTGSKSNLKKTFDKFRDLAGFFKDNEQESADNPVREAKEGRDIVFSEDKLPDPIVISSDPAEKYSTFKTKPQNSIYSISTNFKALDQQDKKNELHNFDGHNPLFPSGKGDTSEFSWEPALKNIFPEAKSINATIRNGNEIIVLDLNRNQLRKEHVTPLFKQGAKQPYAPFGSTAQLPVVNPQFPANAQFPTSNQFPNSQLLLPNGSRKIQMVIEDGSNVQQDVTNTRGSDKSNKAHDRKAYTVFTTGANDAKIIVPSSDASNFSTFIKNIFDKKDSYKAVSKKSIDDSQESKMSEHYNKFLRDLSELSEERNLGNKRQGFFEKTNAYDEGYNFNTIQQVPRGEDPLKYLGNILQNLVINSEPHVNVDKDENFGQGKLQHISSVYSKEGPDENKHRWSLGDERGGEASSVAVRKDDDVSKEEGSAGLRSEMSMPTNEKNSEDELWEELAAASDKIHRLRREGKEKRKRKSVERALFHRERHQSELQNALPDWKSEEAGRSGSDPSFLDSKQSEGARDENGNDLDMVAKLKDEEESKGNADIKTRFEAHLKELIDDLGGNKNQKEQLFVPNQSVWRRKKRKDTRRRKRSTRSDVKNKVSTTAVQNTILKNLAEDNYHSVYFPGIKRRLLSTDIEAEDADSYSDENERDKNVIAEEPQAMCVKNSLNECVDPMIIELLKDDEEEEKDRARRSLTSDYHSDYKREIDLDESMPNDFQNFLVTSLGAFGSQKREVVKKDEALGEGKDSFPDSDNRAAECGKDATEDCALEKREVSSDDNQKLSSHKKYYKSDSFADSNPNPSTKVGSAIRPEVRSSLKSKTLELNDEKLPTQIRIQITNANRKEKKSSKPITEETDTAVTEAENLPEEEEFLDRTKLSSLRKNNLSKLRNLPVSKFNCNEFDDGDYQDNGVKEVPHYTSKRRQKKKKINSETPSNPANDLAELDRKAKESFPKRIVAESNLVADHTTQKSAISNHLPQVETVYNPTQGTIKAQLESSRLTKTSSIGNKNTEKARTSIDAPNLERSKLEEGILNSYLKEKVDNLKSEKQKEFDYWKSPNSVLRLKQNMNAENPPGSSTDTNPYFSSSKQKFNLQKHNPGALNNYNFHTFPKETISPNNLYDALKVRQDMKNRNAANRDRQNSKLLQKTYHMSNFIKQEDKGKTQNSPTRVRGMNSYHFTKSKQYFPQGQDSGESEEYLSPALLPRNEANRKNKMMLSKYPTDSLLDTQQDLPPENLKELDYMDGLEEDYGTEDKETKDNLLANYEQVANSVLKETSKILRTPMYRDMFNYKLSDIDDGVGEDDEDAEEDYEEAGEDELDDYTLLAQKAMDPPEGEGRFRSDIQENPLSGFGFLNQRDNFHEMGSKFASPSRRAKFSSKSQLRGTAERDSELLCKSSSLLKKVNENSNIFGKNLMQNLYGLGYEDSLPGFDKVGKHKMGRLHEYPIKSNKLRKRKLYSHRNTKRSRKPTAIGSRFYYGMKTEISSPDAQSPSTSFEKIKPFRNNNYRLTKEHFLDAEFAGPGNDYENESEEKGKYFNQINFAKNGFSQKVSKERNADDAGNETEDVKENPEDHGETISDDNVLENVIGKYIMRKTVKASTDQTSKRSANKEKSRENRSLWHKRRKRSAGYPERTPTAKVVRRRLSSGHLTENNFRKYHKKNLTKKRHIPGRESVPRGADFSKESPFKKENGKKIGTQRKRSALGLLKKLTNKDRDKKAETPIDNRAAGFEPLSPLTEEKLQGSVNAKEKSTSQERKLTSDLAHMLPKNSLTEPKMPLMSVNCISKEPIIDKKKSKVTLSEGPIQRMQGPWKIELNDKCDSQISDHPLTDLQKGFNKLVDMKLLPPGEELKGLKAFLVIGRSPTLLTIQEPVLPAPGSDLREVGSSSYRTNFEEGRGISNKCFRKRYLKSSVDRMKSGYGGAEKASGELIEKAQSEKAEEANRALHLHETNSFSEGGSRQSTQGLQRNSKISFVISDDQSKTTPMLSRGKLVKRKSAFPPSNDAKIIRDSRHVNEETSEYLGQQVVNAILSHVSANPRFKEVIAPGLAPRTPTYKQENFDKDSTLQQADCSDQLQYFLQRFMYDLEKLAERRVKKRMCNQIDKQAKQFLEFLLAVPADGGKGKGAKEDNCPVPSGLPTTSEDVTEQTTRIFNASPPTEWTTESRVKPQNQVEKMKHTTKAPLPECPEEYTPESQGSGDRKSQKPTTTTECPQEYRPEQKTKTPPSTENSYKDLRTEIDSLRKKCCLLLKLIVDYQNLSKLEKEVLDSKYHSIMLQLDRINKEIKAAKNFPEDSKENRTVANEDYLCCGYKVQKNHQPKNLTHEVQSNCFQTTESPKSANGRNKKPKQNQKKVPKLYFEEMKNPSEADVTTTTCIPVFERVSVGKISELRKESKGNAHTAFEVAPPTTLAPNSFDLLLFSNTTTAPDLSNLTITSTCEPTTIRIPICKPQALPTGDGQGMIMNSISAVNSGSNVPTRFDGQQEAGKGRQKFAPHLPRRRKKRSIRNIERGFKKSEGSTKDSEDIYEVEYNRWSSMPVARRILNSLESGYDFDDLLFQKPKITKKWRRGEKKPD